VHCPDCNTVNDPDARYCSECGRALSSDAKTTSTRTARTYFFALLLIPVVALASGLGYYKFILPEGIAAVVNGEEIKRSELDAAVALTRARNGEENFKGDQSAPYARRLRYEVLAWLITEKLVLQEARKAGISNSPGDVASAVSQARTSSDEDKNGLHALLMQQFGSIPSFEEAVQCELIIKRLLARQAVPQGGDAVNAWFNDLSGRASIRIALSEQWSGAGCGCGEAKTQEVSQSAMSNAGPQAGRAECRHPNPDKSEQNSL
jgi:predicted nucleic acid-binding Zn ribbon protein